MCKRIALEDSHQLSLARGKKADKLTGAKQLYLICS